jgi:hypothetical protein
VSSTTFDTSDLDAGAISIYNFAEYIADAEVMHDAKRIAMDDMENRFNNEIDPSGVRWAPLSKDYAISKAEDGYPIHPILTRTHALRDAATDESAWSVSGESVWFHTGGLPKYWSAHEDGRDFKAVYANIDGDQVYAGKHSGLPKRQFIGLSAGAREEINALVGAWIAAGMQQTTAPFRAPTHYRFGESSSGGTITSYFPGAGKKPQYRVSGKGFGGRFGPMV